MGPWQKIPAVHGRSRQRRADDQVSRGQRHDSSVMDLDRRLSLLSKDAISLLKHDNGMLAGLASFRTL